MSRRILVIEDNKDLAHLLDIHLKELIQRLKKLSCREAQKEIMDMTGLSMCTKSG
jgi:hypothetical protein